MPTVQSAAAQTATLDTEHTLDTVTAEGTYQLVVDLANMANGDIVILRIYSKADSTDTERLEDLAIYGPTKPATDMARSIPYMSPHHFRASLEQTDGTGRVFPWAIYKA